MGPANAPIELHDARTVPLPQPNIVNLDEDTSILATVTGVAGNVTNQIRKALNPFNWFRTQAQIDNSFHNFLETQYNPVTADHRYYPFTVENPYAPWHKRLAMAIFGETSADELLRSRHHTIANYDYNQLRVNPNYIDMGMRSPSVAHVGLGLKKPWAPYYSEVVQENNVGWGLKSIPQTPTITPKPLQPLDIAPLNFSDTIAWQNQVVDRVVSDSNVASGSNVTTDIFDEVTKNILPRKTLINKIKID